MSVKAVAGGVAGGMLGCIALPIIALLALLVIGKCGPEYTPSEESVIAVEFETAVKPQLKDEQSAQFGRVWKTPGGDLCGLVNAKNSFGAYTGERMWYVAAGRATQVSDIGQRPQSERKGLQMLYDVCLSTR